MKNEIFIELFRFNDKTDYLPYYQKYTLKYKDNETINDLLIQMNDIETFGFSYNMNIKVNDVYVNASVLISDMVNRFSNEIRIDSICELRAHKDLLIDRSDFLEKLSILDSYIDAETNISYRKSTELAYYASNTLNYNRNYIGDHVLIIAADLIEKRFELKNEILEILTQHDNGIWLHTSLSNRLTTNTEEEKIQKLVYLAEEYTKSTCKIQKTIQRYFPKKENASFEEENTAFASKVSQNFNGFNIAAYHGVQKSNLEELIASSDATYVNFASSKEDLATNSSLSDKTFTFKIAGDILMQAKDSNADFMIVKNEITKEFFDKNQSEMEKVTGRELGLSIISQNQFVQLLEGEKDISKLGFNNHSVSVNFLSN